MDIWLEVPSPVPAVLPRRVVVPFERALIIGRTGTLGVDIGTTSRSASRLHCGVGRDDCGAWVRDNRSRSGTYLNDRQIGDGSRLLPGDVVRAADFRIRVGWDFEVNPDWLRWQAGLIVSLVRQVRDEKDFTASLILADALEDAGCSNAGILQHLRGPGLHTSDCWALDAFSRRDRDDYRCPLVPD
jgi:predicted component of type VI protein secretion system